MDFVSPTVNFPATSLRARVETAPVPDASQNTPTSLRSLYNVGTTQGTRNVKARQAATAFLEQYYEETDLQSFYKSYYPTLSGVPLSNVIGTNGRKGGIEAALDVE